MYGKIILTLLLAVLIVPAAFCWEYTATFDTDEGWKSFDNDTGAGGAVTPSGGVLSVPYPDYDALSWRYIFVDKDATNPLFHENMDFSQGGAVEATLSYTGSAPTFAYFFLAGGGEDDLIYIDGSEGGSQTFWGTFATPLEIAESPDWTVTATFYFNRDNFGRFSVGPEHDARRGTADSWATTIASVDAVGIVLGYYGDPGQSQLNIDEFTVTPEPSLLLLSGPLAGFLGWKIRRKSRKSTGKA